MRGEHVYPVPPMALPEPGRRLTPTDIQQAEAVDLFVQRATAANPTFTLHKENAATIAEICARLEGLPLAIELAAARLRFLSPKALLAQLSRRFTLLSGGAQDLPARQQTIHDTIAWSYDLLTPNQQATFRRLAVFTGGFTLDAADAVASAQCPVPSAQPQAKTSLGQADSARLEHQPATTNWALGTGHSALDHVAALIDHSLVLARDRDDDQPRYAMLETVRDFASERLAAAGEEVDARSRHAAWYTTFAETAEPELNGPDQLLWLDRLEMDYDNLHAAQEWILEQGQWQVGIRWAYALFVFWQTHHHIRYETAWLERILAITPKTDDSAWAVQAAHALNTLSTLHHLAGDFSAARRGWEECFARQRALGYRPGQASALSNLAMLATDTGDFVHACDLYEESIRLCRELDDRIRLAKILHNYTIPLGALGRDDESWDVLQEVRDILRDGGEPRLYAFCVNSLGDSAWRRGDATTASQLFEEALPLCRQTGNERAVAVVLLNMRRMALAAHQLHRAADHLVEALSLDQVRGDRRTVADLINAQAAVAVASGQAEAGARLIGAADVLLEESGIAPEHPEERDRAVAATIAALGKRPAANARAVGRGLPIDRAIDEAIAVAQPLPTPTAIAPPILISPPSTMPMHTVTLTRRERDVLKLLAEGRSDREIAEALFLSPRTVSTHVSNILGKLDVSTRSAAATYAVRAGLI
ncbi:MAG: LuxR C-terminal-related transcriptional regulator [Thermomicrobiales bacterium]